MTHSLRRAADGSTVLKRRAAPAPPAGRSNDTSRSWLSVAESSPATPPAGVDGISSLPGCPLAEVKAKSLTLAGHMFGVLLANRRRDDRIVSHVMTMGHFLAPSIPEKR